jgi:hypothetical protein
VKYNGFTEAELEQMVSIFPNPATTALNIVSNFKVKTIELYNALGLKVKEQEINNNEATLNIADLPSGNYIAKLHTTQGISTKKIKVK